MMCPQCGQEVGNEARFCSQCGQQLRSVYPACGTENRPESRFCYNCGRNLSEQTGYGEGMATGAGAGVQRPPQVIGCPRCFANNEPGSVYCFRCGLPFEGSSASGAARASNIPAYLGGEPSGFWIRLVAFIVDNLILSLAVALLLVIFSDQSFMDYFNDEDLSGDDAFDFTVNALYFTVAVATWATTVGKRLFRMHVVRKDESKVGAGRAFARYLAYILSFAILGIGFIMVGFRGDKRGLHDLRCNTVVVRR